MAPAHRRRAAGPGARAAPSRPCAPIPEVDQGVYASPDGAADGDGTEAKPWDLATALSQPLAAGTTLWLRGGTYSGSFTSTLTGTAEAPIVVRGYPGERPVVDGGADPHSNTFTIEGAFAWYRDFEVTNSDPTRTIADTGSNPPGARGAGVTINGHDTKIINLVVHDCGVGVAAWSPASDAEVYGTLIFYNGWDAPDRGHGHAIYVQNQNGKKRLVDNVMFRQFSYGIHGYTEGGFIDGIEAEGNVSFSNGELAASGFTTDVLVGGLQIAHAPVLRNNATWFPAGEGTAADLGYSAGCEGLVAEDNYFVGSTALTTSCADILSLQGNTFVGTVDGITQAAWPSNTFVSGSPTGTKVFLRANQYEPGRAHVVVYDWDGAPTVPVDLASVLSVGDAYEIVDLQDALGPALVSGTFDGQPVALPMTSTNVAATVGDVTNPPSHTPAEFGAFLVRPVCP